MANLRRSQPHRLVWPLTPTQVEATDEMLQILFKRLNQLETTIETLQASLTAVNALTASPSSIVLAPGVLDGVGAEEESFAGSPVSATPPPPTYTQGSVLFAGAGGVPTEDNAHLFFDDANNRLGIGTASPGEQLTIQTPTSVAVNLKSGTNSDPIVLEFSALMGTIAKILCAGTDNHLRIQNLAGGNADILFAPNDGSANTVRMDAEGSTRFGAFANSTDADPTGIVCITPKDVTHPTTPPSNLLFRNAYINVGLKEFGVNTYRAITFGWCNNNGDYAPAYIAYKETDGSDFTAGDLIFGTRFSTATDSQPVERLRIRRTGSLAVAGTTGTALVHLPAGTTAASTAPLKIDPGTLLTAPELGAIEFVDNGTTGHLYVTQNVAGVLTRVQIV